MSSSLESVFLTKKHVPNHASVEHATRPHTAEWDPGQCTSVVMLRPLFCLACSSVTFSDISRTSTGLQ